MSDRWPLLFDPYHYRQFAPSASSDDALYDHYLEVGRRRRFAPSPYFDVAWYAQSVPDSGAADFDPLQHFLQIGCHEGRSVHPLFDNAWYLGQYPETALQGQSPIEHFIREGWRAGATPHALFWSGWYRRKYLATTDPAADPFYHYLSQGYRQEKRPNPLFDCVWYNIQASIVTGPKAPDALAAYVVGGHRRHDPHSLFNAHYFRTQRPAGDIGSKSELEVFLTQHRHASPCPLFDTAFFLAGAAQHGLSEDDESLPPLIRYMEQAPSDNVDPHPFFSRKYYLTNAPDIASVGLEPLEHYQGYGWQEHRKVHPLFDSRYYIEKYPDIRGTNALEHYLLNGFQEQRFVRPSQAPDTTERPAPGSRTVLSISATDPVAGGEIGPQERVGVFAHIYYPELAEEMIGFANNAPQPNTTLYISTETPFKARLIQDVAERMSAHPFEIRVFANRGRDVAPFLVGFRDRLLEVDYGVHIHSKRSPHYGQEFDAWRRYLLRETLGSKPLVQSILALLRSEGIGAVAPPHFEPVRKLIQWGGNYKLVEALLYLVDEEITSEHFLDFPSGSMFWFRTKALERLLSLNLHFYHFDAEDSQQDGTLAHAIERSLFYFVEAAGFRWLLARSATHEPTDMARLLEKPRRLWQCSTRIFPTDRELGFLRKYYADCTQFLPVPSPVQKPRINLLIPTAETEAAYAGISTALGVFDAIQSELSDCFDARILTTDTTPSKAYVAPDNFQMQDYGAADVAGVNTVDDGAQRFRFSPLIRENDIFVATAWWTAAHALQMMKMQDQMFGPAARKFLYLIQDFECGFHPYSTRYDLAMRTYASPDKTIPLFNTAFLRDYFVEQSYFPGGYVLQPSINEQFQANIRRGAAKEKLVLLYARPHAERNCLPFLDMLVRHATTQDPELWLGWRFLAIGENFDPEILKCGGRIEVLGRLTIAEYARLASRAALAVTLMISPHPSYPPLEMAEAGVQVLTNVHGKRDLATVHENIHTIANLNLDDAADMLAKLGRGWATQPDMGWNGKPTTDWFFEGRGNFHDVTAAVARDIRKLAEPLAQAVPIEKLSRKRSR